MSTTSRNNLKRPTQKILPRVCQLDDCDVSLEDRRRGTRYCCHNHAVKARRGGCLLTPEQRLAKRRAAKNAWNAVYRKTPTGLAVMRACAHRRRARKLGALVEMPPTDAAKVNLMTEYASVFGFHLDHKDPLAGCKDCGVKGKHELNNLQWLEPKKNFSKNARCLPCWSIVQMREMLTCR